VSRRLQGILLALTSAASFGVMPVLTKVVYDDGAGVAGVLSVRFTLAAVLLNAGVFIVGFRLATARDLTVRQILPGALTAAVIWQLLQSFGGVYVGHVVKSASLINSVFALVLGLLAFIYLAALGVVVATEINVVRVNHLYPRALLTPFTDDVDLTSGDERTYTDAAKAQRTKGFQHIDVTFDGDRSGEPDA